MIRKSKKYARPKKMYQKARIDEENKLVEKYGLKNKREIWKTIAKVGYYRRRAKDLANAPPEEQKVLFGKLNGLGLKISSISDILALKVEDILNRRLPSVLFSKNMANSIRQARQLVVHKKVLIDGNVVNTPGYLVSVGEESLITLRESSRPNKSTVNVGEKVDGKE